MKTVIDEILIEATILGMLDEAMTYDEFLDKSPKITKKGKGGTDQGSSQVSIRTALAYKGQKFRNKEGQVDDSRKDAYAQAAAYIQNGIEGDEISRKQIPADVKDDILKKSPERSAPADGTAKEPAENPARDGQPPEDSFDDAFGDEPTGDDKEKDAEQDAERDAEESDAPEVTKGPMDNEQINEELDYIQDVTGKDKRLREDANPTETDEWTNTNIEPTPDNFSKWQQKSKRDRPDDQKITMSEAMDGVDKPYGFPEKYIEVLERMVNTEGMSDPKKDSVSNFIDGAGAGMIQSQAGEILTMMLTSIPDDEQAAAVAKQISEVLEKQTGKQILDESWVKAAMENRASTMNHVRATYGPDAKITSGCWDLESEVEAMGLDDYTENKGYSTDAYFTVATPEYPDGDLLLEVSLKKDAKVMFYNGGTGDILKPKCESLKPNRPTGCAAMGWGMTEEDFEDVEHDGVTLNGQDYNPAEFKKAQNLVYRENMSVLADSKKIKKSLSQMDKASRDDLIRTLNDKTFKSDTEITEDNLDKLGPKLIQNIMGNYENQFDDNGNKIKSDPSYANDRMNKMAMLVSKSGDGDMREVFDRMNQEHKDFQQNLAKGLLMNNKLRSGLMGILRDEFPIKAAATGEEIMSIGDMVLDRKTCQDLFGTANFNDIKERLSISEDKNGNPIIVYSAQGSGEPIPLANVDIRQKGIGYSGFPSFNLKVHPGFGKTLKESQSALQQEQIKYYLQTLLEMASKV